MQKLNKDFYFNNDVTEIARALLGKIVVTKFNGITTAARIVETEAYAGIVDKASHAYAGRRTARTEIMFGEGGTAYVYLCYGIHHMFNVVTNENEKPDAVLIRGVEPVTGIDEMLRRSKKEKPDHSIGRGPGNAGKALGIFTHHTGSSLLSTHFFITGDGVTDVPVMCSKRIGVDYAGAHAKWLYRFFIKDNLHVTKHAFNKEAIELL
ncbi:MAG: DNA-3-methyladenine glycosylase [Chitinophagaceae bacterium]|nr:DNA-3-methyladenine glycosylase [Chitinophagaceae bacterium]